MRWLKKLVSTVCRLRRLLMRRANAVNIAKACFQNALLFQSERIITEFIFEKSRCRARERNIKLVLAIGHLTLDPHTAIPLRKDPDHSSLTGIQKSFARKDQLGTILIPSRLCAHSWRLPFSAN